jgi:formylglycine-generating enzyme required for sulfatase activity
LASHGGDNPYRPIAERRRDEWLRVAVAQEEHLEHVRRLCPAYEADRKTLARLLALDDSVLGKDAKARYTDEFDHSYGRWKSELESCLPAATGASGALADVAATSDGMVSLPGGTFAMGSPPVRIGYLNHAASRDTEPVHRVEVRAFAMDRTEVTVAAYGKCVQARACAAPIGPRAAECTFRSGRGDLPVSCVDREQARTYCRWAGKRLPTEEEWEYAAKPGPNGGAWPWGGGPKAHDDFSTLACWGSDVHGPCPVGSRPRGASRFGLLDMAGNLWEWTDSPYTADYTSQAVSDRAVIRGGAYSTPVPEMLQVTFRGSLEPQRRVAWVGFRCAR